MKPAAMESLAATSVFSPSRAAVPAAGARVRAGTVVSARRRSRRSGRGASDAAKFTETGRTTRPPAPSMATSQVEYYPLIRCAPAYGGLHTKYLLLVGIYLGFILNLRKKSTLLL